MTPRLAVKGLDRRYAPAGRRLSICIPGEVLGVVALEGQGQDELFDVLAGSVRATAGEVVVEGQPVSFRHPADAIRAGLVYVAADRAEALLMQRNVRENITLPTSARVRRWGLINLGAERKRVYDAVETLQIDARAGAEVRRLSGGNQQKVTIARWVAGGVKTMLCFDPTRGIDIRTKNQIYSLLRDLAGAGAAILFYTSELKEIQLVCDRAIVIFGGRVVAELPAADADEPALLRAAYNLKQDAAMPEQIAAEAVAARLSPAPRRRSPPRPRRKTNDGGQPACRQRRQLVRLPASARPWSERVAGWPGRPGGAAAHLHQADQPDLRRDRHQGLALSVLPLALAAVAQTIVVISGGIDLSIASVMALTNVVAATLMLNRSDEIGVGVAIGVLVLGLVVGAINGILIVWTRVADIIVTLAMSFVWAGFALWILQAPQRSPHAWLSDLVNGLDWQ